MNWIHFLLLVLTINWSSIKSEKVSQTKTPTTDPLVSSLSRFSFDFLSELSKEQNTNIIFSPLSILTAFSAILAGTNGTTKEEITKTFHLEHIKYDDLLIAVKNQADLILSDQKSLNVANKLWVDDSIKLLIQFSEVQKRYFNSEVGNKHFSQHPEKCRSKINKWVEEKTNGKITDLFPDGSINEDTKLVVANAIYFKGLWETPFKIQNTHKDTFYPEDGKIKQIDFMYQNGKYVYGMTGGYNFLEIPYAGNTFSMVLLVPTNNGKIDSLAKEMSNGNLELAIDNFRIEGKYTSDVDIILPKFKIKQSINLKEKLQKLGIGDLFTRGKADLSGITGNRNLYCSDAYHKAFIEVNEEGTEAGAATGVEINVMSMPLQIRINKPFLFFIIHKKSKLIIFNGKVMNPSQ